MFRLQATSSDRYFSIWKRQVQCHSMGSHIVYICCVPYKHTILKKLCYAVCTNEHQTLFCQFVTIGKKKKNTDNMQVRIRKFDVGLC